MNLLMPVLGNIIDVAATADTVRGPCCGCPEMINIRNNCVLSSERRVSLCV